MTQYAEVIFETGERSVVAFDSEDELKSFASEHHRRAIAGEDGGPSGRPAERINRIITYDYHPGSFNPNAVVDPEKIKAKVDELSAASGGEGIEGQAMNAALRDEMSPVVTEPLTNRHDSFYKMEGQDMDVGFLSGSAEGGAV